jgi:hypothetical protein
MAPRPRTAAVLLLVGVAALANPLWLFPNEGERQYTYERTDITVENGTLYYEGADVVPSSATYGADLNGVGCQWTDGNGRACAFDHHILADGNVTVEAQVPHGSVGHPDFVELAGSYYHRNTSEGENGTTYTLEPREPRAVLAALARNVTGLDDPGDGRPALTAVYTGDAVTAFERPERDGGPTGSVYLANGTYYTAAVTAFGEGDAPVFEEWMRPILSIAGMVLLLVVPLLALSTYRGGSRPR